MSICEPCTQLGCLNCISLTNCISCDTSLFYLSAGVCNDICGDGLLYTLECDDGNTISGDGCSQNCGVEKDFTCVGGSTTSPSLCSYSGPIIITISSFIKDPAKNIVYLQSTISPNLTSLASLDFNAVFQPLFTVETTSTVYDPTSGTISTTFTYNQSLNNQ
jgi:cysteine-rich repeat protein